MATSSNKPRVLLVSVSRIFGGAETYYIKLARILASHYELAAVLHNGELAIQMQSIGITVFYSDHSYKGKLHYFSAASNLIRAVQNFRPDVIHLNGQFEICFAPLIRIIKIPFCVSQHNQLDVPPLSPRIKLPYMLNQLQAATQVVCVSTEIFEELSCLLERDILRLIPTWVRGVGEPRVITSVPRTLRILFVGRLIPEKGLLDLIIAMRGLPNAILNVVGEGPELDACVAAATGLEIHFHGFLRDAHRFFDISDVLVFPSHEAYEGLPQVPLEAMAAGLPCLCSDITAIRELCGDTWHPMTFVPGDVVDLRAKLMVLHDDIEYLSELSREGVKRVKQKFTEEIVMPQYLKVFETTRKAPIS